MIPVNGKNYSIRKGSFVVIMPRLIHMDPELYPNPDEYWPERFLGSDLESAMIVVDGYGVVKGEKQPKKVRNVKFFKNGVPVRHYMIPFGGGDHLVFAESLSELTLVFGSSICSE